MSASPLLQAALWGQVFEIAVKRGVLARLRHHGLITPEHRALAAWAGLTNARVYAGVRHALNLVDENALAIMRQAVAHSLTLGYGLGWTAMREYLRRAHERTRGTLELKALWCPLTLPASTRERSSEALTAAQGFREAFGLTASDSVLTARGAPAWSDFTLWLTTSRTHKPDHLLVLEFSYNAPLELPDYRREEMHLSEVGRYARMLDGRGVFSRVCAEVTGERFELAPTLASHLGAFTSRDKPLFKLCQGASYAESTLELLVAEGKLARAVDARVLAVTSNGFESLAAHFKPNEATQEPRVALMRELGRAYRTVLKPGDDAGERLTDEMRMVFNQMKLALPSPLRGQFRALLQEPGEQLEFTFTEPIVGFRNPADRFPVAEALALVNDSPAISAYFGAGAQDTLGRVLRRFAREGQVTLRDLHGAAVVAALQRSRPGVLNALALEGNPGIGKTTAVRRHLMESAKDGYLFLYVSPRVVINKDVTEKFARTPDGASGILTVTTNAILIRAAGVGHREMAKDEADAEGKLRRVDSAVVVDGVDGLKLPTTTSTWFVTPEQEEALEAMHGGQRFRKESLSEREDLIRESQLPGVLRTLAGGVKTLLEANPATNRVVLTAAMQGYRETQTGTTLDGLNQLFEGTKANSMNGRALRAKLARRIPNIVVMIDEVAGDGAGALFVRDIAKWLHNEFLAPFEQDDAPPFTVTLIVSDASLTNATVLKSYLGAGARAPDKVLVSKSAGDRPFELDATDVQLGPVRVPVLHVLTNSFPATTLRLDYEVRMHRLTPELRDDGSLKTVRERIKSQADALLMGSAYRQIKAALDAGAEQAIFFAQDKDFLRRLKGVLTHAAGTPEDGMAGGGAPLLLLDQVEVLDASVHPQKRKKLVQEPKRDEVRVFLMTSSGARGVSFPKATHIIASIPRFNLESALMEVAQLIYRGRGDYTDPRTGERASGDQLPRVLTMLVDDFVADEELDADPRSWVRRASDVLTLVMMLRSTIYTRIKGDAGLPGKDLALVPVGQVGSEELLATMSQTLAAVRQEMRLFLREGDSEAARLVGAASQNVEALFSTFNLKAAASDAGLVTFSSPADLDEFVYTATLEAAPLVPNPEGALGLPDNLTCVGPFWLEDWSAHGKVESFTFDQYSASVAEAQESLRGQLYAITKDFNYPSRLRDCVRDLYRILTREGAEAKREFSTLKPLASKAAWLALPLDYPRFWRKVDNNGMRVELHEEEAWCGALARTLQATGVTLPVIPRYEDFPYAACVGVPDPAGLELVFDDRYFMASTELNLLNTLLLSSADEPDPVMHETAARADARNAEPVS